MAGRIRFVFGQKIDSVELTATKMAAKKSRQLIRAPKSVSLPWIEEKETLSSDEFSNSGDYR
jgi:hypothetical protein